jgi:hypothetical protein
MYLVIRFIKLNKNLMYLVIFEGVKKHKKGSWIVFLELKLFLQL